MKRYDGRTWTTYDVENDDLPFQEIQAMTIDPLDRLWIVSAAGALHLRDADGSWHSYFPQSEMIRLDYIENMAADSQGNIWLVDGLLYKLEPPAP